ncbi:MAG: hypothetical protein OXT09_22610, partial [Myxococcales bacterium]|nr:hypothetical protein [Myxococcales bacterium]
MGDGAKKGGAAALAAAIVDGSSDRTLASYIDDLEGDNKNAAVTAARVVDELVALQANLGAPFIARLVALLTSPQPRVVQTAQHCLPELARVAPAKVAKQMDKIRAAYDDAGDDGRDGVVRTFVALCVASVAYQRRVIDLLERALGDAEPKTLVAWSDVVLPALKGEPHATARAVVEGRLPTL